MDDQLEQGRDRDRPAGRRRLVLVAAAAIAVAIALRADLLSAGGRPATPKPRGAGLLAAESDATEGVVVRQDQQLYRYDVTGRHALARLPADFPPLGELVHVPRVDGTGPLVGVNGTVLFRADANRRRPLVGIGRADDIVAAAGLGRVLVAQSQGGPGDAPRAAELDATTGTVTDPDPFPGYTGRDGWRPVTTVGASFDLTALLLQRPSGGRTQLALAWDRDGVRAAGMDPLTPIDTEGVLLGAAGTRIVVDPVDGCTGPACRLLVVTVTRDDILVRPVEPPTGWQFTDHVVVGGEDDPVVVVSRPDGRPAAQFALARLVAGGRRALVLPGSEQVAPSALPLVGPGGSVIFTAADPANPGQHRLMVWRPGGSGTAVLHRFPLLPAGAQLVCACR